MAPPDLAIRQRQLCSGARPSAQPKSLARRDRNFRSLQGRVTTATPIPRYWTSCMAGWPVDMKAVWARCSRTSDLSIALAVRHFKGLCDEMEDASRKARHSGCFRSWHRAGVIETETGERTW